VTAPTVAVVIVSHDSADDLKLLLPLLDDPRLEVIVVDNASTDDSAAVAERPGVRLDRLADNVGWPRGCNHGARRTQADVLAFVNPDARPSAEQLVTLAERLTDGVGTISPHFVDEAGRTQAFYFRFPSLVDGLFCFLQGGQRLDVLIGSRFIRHRTYDNAAQLPGAVDQPGGACLLMQRATFTACGGFDEDLFLYFADTTLARQVHDRGLRNDVAWDVPVVHAGGTSVFQNPVRWVHLHVQRDYLRYVRRWHGRAAHTAMVGAVLLLTGLVPAVQRLLRGQPRAALDQLRYAREVVR
jgi:GT2 family glycosyltransferase